MPSNSFVISDEAGEFDDWIELYNPGPSAVYLGAYYLTDDIHCPNKWQLPAESMTNNAFRLIWADKDEEQGDYHANFKINTGGEELALFGMQNGALRLIDHIEFPSIVPNYSWGRLDDAGSPWVIFSISTPDASNSGGILNVQQFSNDQMIVYPNPSSDRIRISGIILHNIWLYGLSGKDVSKTMAIDDDELDLSGLEPGIYQLIVEDDQHVIHSRRLVLLP
jgi:hypothetical protein